MEVPNTPHFEDANLPRRPRRYLGLSRPLTKTSTMKVHYTKNKRARWFFDYNIRLWVAQHLDAEGNQIGDAIFDPSKKRTRETAYELAKS